MIGILIVTHGGLARELLKAATSIVGEGAAVEAVGIERSDNPEQIRESLRTKVESFVSHGGCLIFTDLFGGTPTNLCSGFVSQGEVDVVTGVNLPMLMKSLSLRSNKSLGELAAQLKAYGQTNIHVVSDLLS